MVGTPKLYDSWTGIALTLIGVTTFFTALAQPAAQAETGIARIVAPAQDAYVSAAVQIVGTATDPAFSEYDLDYSADPATAADAWTAIQPPIAQQVDNGVLGEWNSTQVPDGYYWIRLRVVRVDGTAIEDQVRVRVLNITPVPTPTETAPPPSATPLPSATPGPSPTSPIWQPPTRTPRPTVTPGGPTATPRPVALADSPFRPERLAEAVRSGVLIALSVFIVFGLYLTLRLAVRGELKSRWQQLQTEYLHPLLSGLRRRRE